MYVYNDEDNYPMNDDVLGTTVYGSRSEMNYYESAEYDRELDARQEAQEIRDCQVREFFLDTIGIDRGSDCRNCQWLREILEQYEPDDDLMFPPDCYDIAEGICEACRANPDRKDEAIENYLKGVE